MNKIKTTYEEILKGCGNDAISETDNCEASGEGNPLRKAHKQELGEEMSSGADDFCLSDERKRFLRYLKHYKNTPIGMLIDDIEAMISDQDKEAVRRLKENFCAKEYIGAEINEKIINEIFGSLE